MKNESGITLITLVFMIVIMVMISSVAITYGVDTLTTVKFQNFGYELQQVQGKVDVIYEKIKLNDEEYLTKGRNITDNVATKARETLKNVKNIDYELIDSSNPNVEDYYYKEDVTSYRYFSEGDLKKEFDISSNPGDMIINFKTREVISVSGFEYEGKMYYSLSDIN